MNIDKMIEAWEQKHRVLLEEYSISNANNDVMKLYRSRMKDVLSFISELKDINMKDRIIYQICVEGDRKHFESKGKFNSKNLYLNSPTQKDIDNFVDKCCNSKHPNDLYDIVKNDNIRIKILALTIGENLE